MSIPPSKDRFDHIFDFFFGSPKKVSRTFIVVAIIIGIIYIDEITMTLTSLAYKLGAMIMNVLNHLISPLIIMAVLYFGFKKLLGKK